ncbi:nitroreductase/NAD-dependent dihydropyrimidine dehydrogenase PreA subunit [Clostridium acetobutylicum]|uniref:Nitroreductase family protein fused to ferredoxin domain n=1 Tax=Clostridium acetobutylicum (strain ATCC 824 / DSM 792 / JCM 1419 / IAM 19013 / LMG 5710 / NBRC 13948 / NRRL B-527 / VKM B-1787 / 2291 / W) TaxID=272562 RepID=Q97DW1_CLOAB|nr:MULTISPECIES: nitroreductase family protein [Clostridium]AAK81291.1 Nitroreductase family protein fused to ferredoxin domain [Clostridium acetobutylicum ATCC 824]ADZ22399.1 Nitroreductase family protein fused to ferredoxin domain [Clostridium acetobutylicum EA 2018]AEI32794.1 nitroreductase family protein [Clostridium acetobutylicum DSM 1731]AWV81042.1 4Fe-4S dicluster domain-containing protein [Clostridium acetobutylicum]KHD36735.1 nitroreductase [Clostridium acetobutylicum]
MMTVDIEKCIGCGKCVKDCFPKDIEIVDGKAKINNETCIKCGHCIAVCPMNAVSTDDYDMSEVKEYNKEEFSVDADKLMNFIKFRRTIRQYKDKDIEKEKIEKIIEAGRFTQTGSNMQDVSYIVVKDKINELKDLVFESLKNIGQNMLKDSKNGNALTKRYAEMWLKMYEAYKEDPVKNDRLFFNAPAVIVVTAASQVNGALASSNMELMTDALGLGTFFSGFFIVAAQNSKEIQEFLGIHEGKQAVTCMVMGYPNVTYARTTPRKEADISWK